MRRWRRLGDSPHTMPSSPSDRNNQSSFSNTRKGIKIGPSRPMIVDATTPYATMAEISRLGTHNAICTMKNTKDLYGDRRTEGMDDPMFCAAVSISLVIVL